MTVAFLFLTYKDPHHVWKGWFPDDANVYISNKYPSNDPFFSKYCINCNIDTQWAGWSLVWAFVELIKAALSNPSNTHFMFLSDSCIPLVSYEEAVNQICSYDKCVLAATSNISYHSQWLMLTKEGADAVVSYKKKPPKFQVPDESYVGFVLSRCEIPTYNRVLTHVNWENKYKHANGLQSPTAVDVFNLQKAQEGCLFYRKIAPTTAIACVLMEPKWENLLAFWSTKYTPSSLPRDVAFNSAVRDIVELIESKDKQRAIQVAVDSITSLKPLCKVPFLVNGNTKMLGAWVVFNAQLYTGGNYVHRFVVPDTVVNHIASKPG